jgi:PAS domain S-box-containing protein
MEMELHAQSHGEAERNYLGVYLFEHIPYAIAVGVILLITIYIKLGAFITPLFLNLWALLLVAVLAMSSSVYLMLRKSVRQDHRFDEYWVRLLLLNSNLFAGLCVMLFITVFSSVAREYQFLILLIAGAMSAIAMPALMLFNQVYITFVSILLLPLVVCELLLQSSTDSLYAAVLLLLYLGLIASSLMLARSMRTLVAMKYSNMELVDRLAETNISLEESNALLQKEIEHRKKVDDTLRERSQHLEQIMEATGDALLVLDKSGKVSRMNSRLREICGYSPEEILGRHYINNILPHSDPGISVMIHDVMEGKSGYENQEAWLMNKQGRMLDVRLSIQAIPHGEGVDAVVCTLSDITHDKEKERIKDDFISTVSHELRTPLTSIHGTLKLVEGGVAGKLPERVQKLIKVAVNNSDRLSLLLNDLLDIQRLDAGRVEYEMSENNACEVVEEAVEASQGYATNYHVRLQLLNCLDALIWTDRTRLIQVLFNLISNAIKFTPEGDSVEVNMSSLENKVRIAISDHGGGIPEMFRPYLFDRFSPQQGGHRQHRGTGLGLSIAKQIIESMGGAIAYETHMGEGTTFFVDIGLAQRYDANGDEQRYEEIE